MKQKKNKKKRVLNSSARSSGFERRNAIQVSVAMRKATVCVRGGGGGARPKRNFVHVAYCTIALVWPHSTGGEESGDDIRVHIKGSLQPNNGQLFRYRRIITALLLL